MGRARRQEREGSVGGKRREMEGNDDPFAAFRYTGGPIRSKPPPSSAGASFSRHPTPPIKPLVSSAASASAGAARHPMLTPPPPPRSNPKPMPAFATAEERNKWLDDHFASFRYTGGASSSSSPPPPTHPASPAPRTPPPRPNPKKRAAREMGGPRSSKPRTTLTAAERRSDAYRRIAAVDPEWSPPACAIRLLQEAHYSDPWRVLVICMLLNRTSGTQVKRVLDDFFELCPDAEAAKDVRDEALIELITSLGFGYSRTGTIKRFSREYLESEWTHVTQLYGVGKYAADAYTIFCVGDPEKVRPADRKLVPYWKCLCKMGVQKENKSELEQSGGDGTQKTKG